MAEAKVQRRLAAILAADVVGYSQLIRADEEGTLARFKTLRAELIDPPLAEHGGRIVKLMGDGILVEFASVVSAVRAAAEIQQAVAEANADVPEHTRIEFRMGINLGDVVIDGDDIHGDGVNVAARLEGVAEPGGICISESVYEQVRDRTDLVFADYGERQVKNIDRPIKTYAWHVDPDRSAKNAPAAPEKSDAESSKPDRKPTIALTAFETVGRNEDAEILAAAVTDAVTSALSNQTGLILLHDPAQSDYLARGSIQAAGSRYRATVQVLDRRSGEQFASERFDGDLSDLFEAQDDLAYRASTMVRFAVSRRQFERVEASAASEGVLEDTDALLTKAGYLVMGTRRADWQEALKLMDGLLIREPDNFMALTIKAMCHIAEAFLGFREVPSQDGEAALLAIQRATELNPNSDFAHFIKANVHLHYQADVEAAKRAWERSLELNPYYSMALHGLGWISIYQGDAESGIELGQKALDADPRMPLNYVFMGTIAYGQFIAGRFAEAVDWAQRSDQQAADMMITLLVLASAAHHAGQAQLAAGTVARMVAIEPGINLGELRRQPFRNADHWQLFVDGLRDAGIPE